jgi:hypothetical protein
VLGLVPPKALLEGGKAALAAESGVFALYDVPLPPGARSYAATRAALAAGLSINDIMSAAAATASAASASAKTGTVAVAVAGKSPAPGVSSRVQDAAPFIKTRSITMRSLREGAGGRTAAGATALGGMRRQNTPAASGLATSAPSAGGAGPLAASRAPGSSMLGASTGSSGRGRGRDGMGEDSDDDEEGGSSGGGVGRRTGGLLATSGTAAATSMDLSASVLDDGYFQGAQSYKSGVMPSPALNPTRSPPMPAGPPPLGSGNSMQGRR